MHSVLRSVVGVCEVPLRRTSSRLGKFVGLGLAGLLSFSPARGGEGDFQSLNWQLHRLAPDSQYSACAVLDLNGDGKKDIYCGGYWYEAPTWARRVTRDVPAIGGRYDDYSNLPLDVNQDGRTDVISVNYRSRSIFWIEQPADLMTRWTTHLIDSPGPSETGRLVDVDADGQRDLLPNGTTSAAWYALTTTSPTPVWQRFELPSELAGHGIGWGDIDGDGRIDLVGPRGWAKSPTHPRTERWLWQGEFRLHADASIPILVEDVDRDGDRDLLWGRAHHSGVYWLEHDTSGSRRSWRMHAIDTQVSQSHSLFWQDVDGNGIPDLIIGKRWLAHDGRDVGEWDPMHVVRYEYHPTKARWHRQWISEDGSCGVDLDGAVVDLDDDGDLDIVAPTRVGLCWLENRGASPKLTSASHEHAPNAQTPINDRNTSSLLVLKSVDGKEQAITRKEEWGQRRAQLLLAMQEVMGPLPGPEHRPALNVEVESEERLEKYTRKKIVFSATSAERVPAYLLIPHDSATPRPAMLCLHQTQPLGKGEVCGLGGKRSMFYGHELAERGYVCLAPDYPSFGDYACEFDASSPTSTSGSMKAIWNNLRAVDLLESLPEVDPDRIGSIGHSLGGHNALFTAAFDQRIRAVVTSCGFTSFFDYYGGNLKGWTSNRYMPRIAAVYGSDPRRIPFDFEDVLGAICPRSIFVNAPAHDDNFEVGGVRKVMDRVDELYRWYGLDAHRVIALYPEASHDFPDAIRQQAYEWLDDQLDLNGTTR